MEIPFLLLPFEKSYVKAHTRKGKKVGPYFTKRQPKVVDKKHVKARFFDHDKQSANKAHKDLENKKDHHKTVLQALSDHHEHLVKTGPKEGGKGLAHHEKLSHLKTEIKNQQTHIDNHSRKQEHIKNRYSILKKQAGKQKKIISKDPNALKTYEIKTRHIAETRTGNLDYTLKQLGDVEIIETKDTMEYGEKVKLVRYWKENTHIASGKTEDEAIESSGIKMHLGKKPEIISVKYKGEKKPVEKKPVTDAEELLYEMDANKLDEITIKEGFGQETTYTRKEIESQLGITR